METKKETGLAPSHRDPLALMRQMTSELERVFDESSWRSFRWPSLRWGAGVEETTWAPRIDVFEKNQRLVTRIDLPGMKKEDVKVEVTDGQLAISGERKHEKEEKGEKFYRSEREYGSFYRAVPLPEGAKVEDVKAMFTDGVLEVSVPLPAKPEAKARTIEIQEPTKATKTAA
jgi:HSP20 family protein